MKQQVLNIMGMCLDFSHSYPPWTAHLILRGIILLCVTFLVVPCFATLSQKRLKKKLLKI